MGFKVSGADGIRTVHLFILNGDTQEERHLQNQRAM